MTRAPGINGAWTWHQDPRAIHYNGVTYVGVVDDEGSIIAYSYDHETGDETETIVAPQVNRDDHIGPVLHRRRTDDHILIFYARGNDTYHVHVSDNPLDISSFGDGTLIDDSASTYPNPVEIDNFATDEIWLWNRQGYRDQYLRKSTDGGVTWNAKMQFSDFDGERCYLKTATTTDRIYTTMQMASESGTTSKIYLVYWDDTQDAWFEMDGTQVATEADLPIAPSDLTTIVESDTDLFRAQRVWDLALDANNHPRFLHVNADDVDNHKYYQTRWDGSAWITTHIVDGGKSISEAEEGYSGGLCYNHANISEVYCAVEDKLGNFEIEKGMTADGGDTWSFEQITDRSGTDNWRPCPIRNPHGNLPVMWLYVDGHYTEFTNYENQLASSELSKDGSFADVTLNIYSGGTANSETAQVSRDGTWVAGNVKTWDAQ